MSSKYNFQNNDMKNTHIGDHQKTYYGGKAESEAGSETKRKDLSDDDLALCVTVVFDKQEEQDANRQEAVAAKKLLWPKDTKELKIYFIPPFENNTKNQIMEVVKDWTDCTGINFVVSEDVDDSHIRITMEGKGCHSIIGTKSLEPSYKGKATMCLAGIIGKKDHVVKRHVLHEFGHALGLHHEHQNPNAKIPWDLEKTFDYYKKYCGWDQKKVIWNVLQPKLLNTNYTEFDKDSIMRYPVRIDLLDENDPSYASWSKDAADLENRPGKLSKTDRDFFQKYYSNSEKKRKQPSDDHLNSAT